MNDGDLLLKAILANPDDDTPRLVYADWLDEQAMARDEPVPCPRADMIRGRILSQTNCELSETILRNRDFVHACRNSDFHLEVFPPYALIKMRNGFFEKITCTANEWLGYADAITAKHPIRAVVLTTIPNVQFAAYRHGREEVPGKSGWEYSVEWRATSDYDPEGMSFRAEILITEREMLIPSDPGVIRVEDFYKSVSDMMTPAGYLRCRWPKIAFRLPPMGSGSGHIPVASWSIGPAPTS